MKNKNYNKLIGRIGSKYYFLDYLFKDGDFKGATGSVMHPMTKRQYNERVNSYFDPENMREFWMQAVKANSTELGLNDWIQKVKDIDGEEGVIDRSDKNYKEVLQRMLGDSAFEVECVGGGRCFDKKMKWDRLFSEILWEEIQEYETN